MTSGALMPGPENFLALLGQADDRQIAEAERVEFPLRAAELALAAVDDDEAGPADAFVEHARVAPPHDLGHAGEIVLALDRLDPVAAIVRAVRLAAA